VDNRPGIVGDGWCGARLLSLWWTAFGDELQVHVTIPRQIVQTVKSCLKIASILIIDVADERTIKRCTELVDEEL
jgi:hypothetical protein